MERLNRLIEQYGRWAELKIYTDRIEAHIETDFSISLENSKALIETICKEICTSKEVDVGANPNINQMLKKAFNAIGYSNSTSITQISSALSTIGQQMGVLRNEIGTTSHGRSLEELKKRNNNVDEITKEFLIDTTVIVVSFLIKNFENENPRTTQKTPEQNISLNDNPEFNDFWDESYGEFSMGDYSYTASDILFYVDTKAYLAELKVFEEDGE
ncbi:MAG: abortive infection family protein [Methanosarcinaceae archaeon]